MDKIPNINNKNKEDLIEEIKRLSVSYTPQWRFDETEPDMGTALAIIFAAMQADTLSRYNELPLKWRTEYFNNLNTSLLPKQPAFGYVTFSNVSEEVEGVELLAGTRLTTNNTDSSGNVIPVETRDDVFVVSSHLQAVYESNDNIDYIGKLWDENEPKSFYMFGFDKENIQHHAFFIGHSNIFSISKGGEVEVEFFTANKQKLSKDLLYNLQSNGNFYYSSNEGFIPFERYYYKENAFVFVKSNSQPPWTELEINGVKQYWIKYELNNGINFHNMLSIGEIRLKSRAYMISPENIYAAGTDVNSRGLYFPFGEQLSVYEEVYFSCDEVLNKKGAYITMSFLIDYIKIPLNMNDKEKTDWRLIMPKNAVKIDMEYDITISKVIWEYFNGVGWVRLFDDDRYDTVFTPNQGIIRQKKTLRFICPQDISPAIINSAEKRCIRAKIVNLNNRFKTNGQYISPMVSETYFSYEYEGKGLSPEFIYEENNGKGQIKSAKQCFNQLGGYTPIRLAGDNVPTIYCCFSMPLVNGPIRILTLLGNGELWQRPRLKWQYFGSGKWRDINIADETKSFENSGIISFNGMNDFEKIECFGKEGYWIRIQDISNGYDNVSKEKLPLIEGIYINSVKAWTMRTNVEEYITFEDFDASTEFNLLNYPVYNEQVWVNETGTLSKGEEMLLEKQGRLRYIVKNPLETETWVLWERTESFYEKAYDGRKYMLDRGKGILKFSSGTNYRLPPPGVANGIYINMSIGGGEECNIKKGEVNGMELNQGFINSAWNPVGFSGGCDKETPNEAMNRMACGYKHHYRAVTTKDYEKLAKEASRMVYKAFCFAGRSHDGKRKGGYITIVILQKDYKNSHYFFHSLKDIVMEYLKDKVFENLISQNRLHIVSPDFIEIQIGAEIKVNDFNEIFNCKHQIYKKLEEFLNPISGNFNGNGFDVGILPNRNQIETVIKGIPSVKEIRNLVISGNIYKGGEIIEINMEEMKKYPYALPVNGNHRIFVKTE